MGERLLCKQEVVGSIPSASMGWLAGDALAWRCHREDHEIGVPSSPHLQRGPGWWRVGWTLSRERSLFIVTVNQVLVRLWADRLVRLSDRQVRPLRGAAVSAKG